MADDNPLRSPLPAEALEVIDFVHSHLRANGRWPIGQYVARSLGGRIALDGLVRTLPMLSMARYGPIPQSGGGFVDLAKPLKVTISGLAQVPAAAATVASVLDLVADVAARFVDLPPDPDQPVEMHLRRSDLAGLVLDRVGGDGKLDADIVLAVFVGEPPGWGAHHLVDGAEDATWQVSDEIMRYLVIEDVDAYLDVVAGRLGGIPGQQANTPTTEPSPMAVPMLDSEAEADASEEIGFGGLHPLIHGAARALWFNQHHREAVAAAAEALVREVKSKLDRPDLPDTALWQEVFSANPPSPGKARLRWPGRPDDRSVRSMNDGLRQFAPGMQMTIRNGAVHSSDVMVEQDALERLAVLSLMARWLEACVIEET